MARGMLRIGRMFRASLVALVLAVTASGASAGTYLGLGVGTSADVGLQSSAMTGDSDHSGRLIIGSRFGRWSIEGDGTRFGAVSGIGKWDGTQLAAALKLDVPLAEHLFVFAKGGLERTWLSSNTTQRELSGNGWLLGAGLEYRLDLLVTGASVFFDYNRSSTTFQVNDTMQKLDGTASMWTLGLTLHI